MSLGSTVYRSIFSKTSTAALTVISVAFFFERGVSLISDYTFDTLNKGVCFLYSVIGFLILINLYLFGPETMEGHQASLREVIVVGSAVLYICRL